MGLARAKVSLAMLEMDHPDVNVDVLLKLQLLKIWLILTWYTVVVLSEQTVEVLVNSLRIYWAMAQKIVSLTQVTSSRQVQAAKSVVLVVQLTHLYLTNPVSMLWYTLVRHQQQLFKMH